MRAHASLLRLAACLPLIGACLAQVPAVTTFTAATQFGSVTGTDQTIGFTFTPTVNIVVSALGVWDANAPVAFTQTHQVGLWDSSGTLLASTTVLTTSPLTGAWRYVAITPVTLLAGQTYFAGSAITSPYTDAYSRISPPASNVTTSPLIAIGPSTTNAASGGFSFPSAVDVSFVAPLGPNLIVAAAPATAPSYPLAIRSTP